MTDENRILQDALSLGIIDLATLSERVEDMQRSKYLEMHTYSIWQGGNGYWYTRLPLQNNERRLIKKKTRADVEDAIVEHYKEHRQCPNFKATFKEWLDYKIKHNEICRGTFDRYSTEFERFFKGTFMYDAPIESITDDDLDEFIRKRVVDLNMTAKAYGNMRTLIIGTFKYAKRQGFNVLSISTFFGDFDISRKVFVRKKRDDMREVFNDDEIPRLMKYLEDNPSIENYGILLVFYCGIREGELSALKYSDLQGNKLHIIRQEIKYKSEQSGVGTHEIVDYTKTDAGERYIVLPNKAVEIINKIHEMNPDGEYLMMVGKRKVWTNTFNDRIYKACDAIGIPRRSMHKIRKTYGTALIDAGVEDAFIKCQMGHSDIATTRRYYCYSKKNDSAKQKQIETALCFE